MYIYREHFFGLFFFIFLFGLAGRLNPNIVLNSICVCFGFVFYRFCAPKFDASRRWKKELKSCRDEKMQGTNRSGEGREEPAV